MSKEQDEEIDNILYKFALPNIFPISNNSDLIKKSLNNNRSSSNE